MREITLFNRNIGHLKNRPMGVELSGLSYNIPDDVKVLSAKTGIPTLLCSGKVLHSQFDPLLEAKRFSESLGLKKGDCLFLYGFGMAYHIDSILEILGEEGKLIVLELNRDILSASLSLRDFSALFTRDNFWLISGGDEQKISTAFFHSIDQERDRSDKTKKVAIHLPSYQLIPPGFHAIKNSLELVRMERSFDSILGEATRQNINNNKEIVEKSPGIKELFGQFEKKPGFLIGAGPSLDLVLKYLRYIPKESVLVAADSAMAALLRAGIRVDYVISIDPQIGAFYHLAECLKANIPLIFMPQTNSLILEHYTAPRYVVLKAGIDNTIEIDLFEDPDKGSTQGGGAVSCVALDLLIKFGANPIVMAGMDSSFPWDRYYSNEISYCKTLADGINRNMGINGLHRGRIVSDEIIKIKNCFNKEITTHRNLYSYHRTLEELVSRTKKKVTFYQWHSHGARIKEVKNIQGLHESCTGHFKIGRNAVTNPISPPKMPPQTTNHPK